MSLQTSPNASSVAIRRNLHQSVGGRRELALCCAAIGSTRNCSTASAASSIRKSTSSRSALLKRLEHVCGRIHATGWASDSDLEPGIVPGPERGLDRSQAVVAAVAAFEGELETPEREIDVVIDDQQVLALDLEILRDGTRLAGRSRS